MQLMSSVKDKIVYQTPFVDTHCHWPLTLETYMRKTNDFSKTDAYDFIQTIFGGKVIGNLNFYEIK